MDDDLHGERVMLDSTQLLAYMSCPEKYRLSFIEGLEKAEPGESERPKLFGSAIHRGLEAMKLGQPPQEATRQAQAAYTVAVPESERLYRPEHLTTILKEYSIYALQNFTDWEVLEVEQPFVWQPDGQTDFLVKSDLRIKRGEDHYAINYKTTKKYVDEGFWKKWAMHFQTKAEVEAVRVKYGSCAGLILVALQFGHRTRAWKGEPPGFWCRVSHQELNVPEHQLVDWRVNVKVWLNRISLELGYPKHESNCSWCEYFELCLSSGNPQVREALYTVKPNPLAYQEVTHGPDV